MINKVILIGKIQESNLRFTNEGLAVLKFVLRTWEGQKGEFHRITYFDPEAERAYRYNELFNGDFNGYVYVEGKLSYQTYTGKDGLIRRTVDIIARNIRLISANPKNGKSEEQTTPTPNEKKNEEKNEEKNISLTEEIENEFTINEDDLPF